jgi:hypothetical protein
LSTDAVNNCGCGLHDKLVCIEAHFILVAIVPAGQSDRDEVLAGSHVGLEQHGDIPLLAGPEPRRRVKSGCHHVPAKEIKATTIPHQKAEAHAIEWITRVDQCLDPAHE